MNSVDRGAARVRRDEIAATYSKPFGNASSLRLVNEVVELLNQAQQLDALVDRLGIENKALTERLEQGFERFGRLTDENQTLRAQVERVNALADQSAAQFDTTSKTICVKRLRAALVTPKETQ